MADLSPVPISVRDEIRRPKAAKPAPERSKVASVTAASPRKLVRPSLPEKGPAPRNFGPPVIERRKFVRGVSSLSTPPRSSGEAPSFSEKTSRAETFYLQKQAHSQTLMVFVLDDGERIGGYIEWYDRDVIKVRHGGRILIYKSSIKYLYKAEENIRI